MLGIVALQTSNLVQSNRKILGAIDTYINTNHEKCPRGHEAHYIYYQWPARPILLCDEQYDAILREPCPFEYYTFLQFLNSNK